MTVIDMDGRTPAQKQGLLSQLIVPRPIAMISTLDAMGRLNVAPFSYYMPISGEPPMLAVTVGALRQFTDEPKDTWVNLQHSGEFVINVTTVALGEHIETVAREYPSGVDEAEIAGWRTLPSQRVAPPSLAESPAHLECVVREVIDRGDHGSCFSGVHIVLAEVVCITVDDSILAGPHRIDPTRVDAIGRMGFPWFVTADEHSLFSLERKPA
jgi:flavin reductase (DIM6/NTAB) family NADH-FMN oxidoreductase RutF